MKRLARFQVRDTLKLFSLNSYLLVIGPGAYVANSDSKPQSRMEVKPNNIFVTKVREYI